jgi:hypothetical protein
MAALSDDLSRYLAAFIANGVTRPAKRRTAMSRRSVFPLLLLTAACTILTAACLHSAPATSPATGPARAASAKPAIEDDARRRLVAAKARIMAADYRADLTELARVREEIVPLAGDATDGYLVRYWAGYASWRVALNGASHGMSSDELRGNLERAAADFDAATALRPDFADGYAAAASVNGWLTAFHREDPDVFREYVARSGRNLARAKELAPDNPRVLWVAGGDFLFKPPQWGGSTERAIEIYVRAADVAAAPQPDSPLPDWGKPEALMSLAYAHMNQKAPDLVAAEKEARAALRLQPQWSYVKDVLLPQIQAAASNGAKGPAASSKSPG